MGILFYRNISIMRLYRKKKMESTVFFWAGSMGLYRGTEKNTDTAILFKVQRYLLF